MTFRFFLHSQVKGLKGFAQRHLGGSFWLRSESDLFASYAEAWAFLEIEPENLDVAR